MLEQAKLSDIQAWLHTFVVEPGTQSEALTAAERKAGFQTGSAEELILPSPTLSPRERIQIYRGMYLLRMQEALEIDFPSVLWYVGGDEFKALVTRYVERHPSRSYTIDHLGRHFAGFLTETMGPGLGELAALEWSMCEVAVIRDAPVIEMSDLASVAEDNFLRLSFEPVPALRHHHFQTRPNVLLKAWSSQSERPDIELEESRMVVWRHRLNVWRQELSPAGHEFLSCLCEGTPLGTSLDSTMNRHRIGEDELFQLFQNWVGEGFFSSFSVSPSVH